MYQLGMQIGAARANKDIPNFALNIDQIFYAIADSILASETKVKPPEPAKTEVIKETLWVCAQDDDGDSCAHCLCSTCGQWDMKCAEYCNYGTVKNCNIEHPDRCIGFCPKYINEKED